MLSETAPTSLESSFLTACRELVTRQLELAPQLAASLGVPVDGILYSWMRRSFPRVVVPGDEPWRLQVGEVEGTRWGYYFHGLECDLRHRDDGRYVRIEFGPRGRVDVVSKYAVLQFVMTSVHPWTEFPSLRSHLAEKPPPYDAHSGSYQRAGELWERMEERGLVQPAAPDLCELVAAHTRQLSGGGCEIRLPEGLPETTYVDCMVCGRHILSEAASDVGESRRT